jgi:predicted amidophosphoribosyltransferase
MGQFFDFLLDSVRCCVNCGSLFPKRFHLLCATCWESANQDRSWKPTLREHVSQRTLQTYALWDWVPDKNNALSHLLVSLKGTGLSSTWKILAEQLVEERRRQGARLDFRPLFVPAPPTRPDQKDHAYQLAWALAEVTGGDLLPCLQKVSRRHQKGLRRSQREWVSIRKIEKFSQKDFSEMNIVFVDDVITTGGTAFASLLALEPVKSCEVWGLAQRELPCDKRRALL